MTEAEIAEYLKQGLALVKAGAPMVEAFGGTAGNVAAIADQLASIGQTVLKAREGFTSDSLTEISGLTDSLQAENDRLAVLVDNS